MSLLKRNEPGRLDPFRELQRAMERFNTLWGDEVTSGSSALTKFDWSPSANVTETPKAYVVKVELPEVKREDVHVQVDNGVLTLSGERKYETEDKDEHRHRVESHYGSFMRTFRLPDNVSQEGIEAKFNDGVLKVKIPKQEKAQPKGRRIQVS